MELPLRLPDQLRYSHDVPEMRRPPAWRGPAALSAEQAAAAAAQPAAAAAAQQVCGRSSHRDLRRLAPAAAAADPGAVTLVASVSVPVAAATSETERLSTRIRFIRIWISKHPDDAVFIAL